MKTIITAKENQLSANFDLRFGRGAWFCLYNSDDKTTTFIKNEYSEAQGGAGTKVAEQMVELGIHKVISGDFGPKAKSLLSEFNIQMVIIEDDEKTIEDIIQLIS